MSGTPYGNESHSDHENQSQGRRGQVRQLDHQHQSGHTSSKASQSFLHWLKHVETWLTELDGGATESARNIVSLLNT